MTLRRIIAGVIIGLGMTAVWTHRHWQWRFGPEPTEVVISRTVMTGSPIPSLAPTTITNADNVQVLYDALETLPEPPNGTFNCPQDPGIRYHLRFLRGSQTVAQAVANPAGCRFVSLIQKGRRVPQRWAEFQSGRVFWTALATALHEPLNAVLAP